MSVFNKETVKMFSKTGEYDGVPYKNAFITHPDHEGKVRLLHTRKDGEYIPYSEFIKELKGNPDWRSSLKYKEKEFVDEKTGAINVSKFFFIEEGVYEEEDV